MSDEQSNEPEERKVAEDDAGEDLELSDENADQVSGGLIIKEERFK